jgi:prophage regulatory protein
MAKNDSKEVPDSLLKVSEVCQLLSVGEATWWAGVKSGRYPKSVKLGPRITRWRRSDIDKLIR